MEDRNVSEFQLLESRLLQAEYGLKFYSEKLADQKIQIDQLSMFASQSSLKELTLHLCSRLSHSKSQLLQDLLVSFLFDKPDGFFCEFGAADGVTLSNTYYLEELGWKGILAEPSRRWHELLDTNRNCNISHECVYPNSGEQVIFNEVDEGMFSSLLEFSSSDMHAHRRTDGFVYPVESISLEDLLHKFSAPKYVDFLSVDTEGSELAILDTFNFNSFKFGAIFVEHNFTENREKIYDLLTANGYLRIFSRFSRWDDWYLSQNRYDFLKSKIGDGELL